MVDHSPAFGLCGISCHGANILSGSASKMAGPAGHCLIWKSFL
jgi:hypothetical protein